MSAPVSRFCKIVCLEIRRRSHILAQQKSVAFAVMLPYRVAKLHAAPKPFGMSYLLRGAMHKYAHYHASGNYISHAKVHAANIKRNAANKIECPSKRNKASWGEDYNNPDKQCKKTHRNRIFTRLGSTPENTHGLSQKIQGTYFKISALYFKIYALYFSPFQIAEKQCLEKGSKNTGQTAEIRPEYVAYSACCEREMLILLLCRLFLPRKSFLFCHRPRSCLF